MQDLHQVQRSEIQFMSRRKLEVGESHRDTISHAELPDTY